MGFFRRFPCFHGGKSACQTIHGTAAFGPWATATAMPGVQPVTVESRAGIQSRGLGYEPSWSCILAGWGWGDYRRIIPVSKWLITTFRVVPVPNSITWLINGGC